MLVTRWIQPAPALQTAWFGPDGRIEAAALQRPDAAAVPVVIGPRGPEGAAGGANSITWRPPSALETWIIPHNLGHYPTVQIFDVDGAEIGAAISQLDVNTLSISFGVPMSGMAVLI